MTESETQDREANIFAMCLLMPENLVRAEVKKLGNKLDICDGANINILARKFAVSEAIMTLRLGQLYRINL